MAMSEEATRAGDRTDRRSGAALVASLLLHAGIAALLLAPPRVAPRRAAELEPITVVLVPHTTSPRSAVAPAEETPAPSDTTPAPAAIARRPARRAAAIVEALDPIPTPSAPTEATALPATAPLVAEPAPSPAITGDAARRLPDPAAVARAWFVPEGPGPSRRGPPASATASALEAPDERALEEEHRRFLRASAMARPWVTRAEPELRRLPDGRLAYDGHAFRAVIEPDGSVSFAQRSAVDLERELDLSSGRFDLDALFSDVYRYERQWFMDRTEEVRDRMDAEHRAREAATALRVLPGRLERLWTGPGSAAWRRRRIHAAWDELADDDAGRAARAVVEAWVRERLPAGSEDAFDAAELARLNAGRRGARIFAPYAP